MNTHALNSTLVLLLLLSAVNVSTSIDVELSVRHLDPQILSISTSDADGSSRFGRTLTATPRTPFRITALFAEREKIWTGTSDVRISRIILQGQDDLALVTIAESDDKTEKKLVQHLLITTNTSSSVGGWAKREEKVDHYGLLSYIRRICESEEVTLSTTTTSSTTTGSSGPNVPNNYSLVGTSTGDSTPITASPTTNSSPITTRNSATIGSISSVKRRVVLNISDRFDRLYYNFREITHGFMKYLSFTVNEGEAICSVENDTRVIFRCDHREAETGLPLLFVDGLDKVELFKITRRFRFIRKILRLSKGADHVLLELINNRKEWVRRGPDYFQREYLELGFAAILDYANGLRTCITTRGYWVDDGDSSSEDTPPCCSYDSDSGTDEDEKEFTTYPDRPKIQTSNTIILGGHIDEDGIIRGTVDFGIENRNLEHYKTSGDGYRLIRITPKGILKANNLYHHDFGFIKDSESTVVSIDYASATSNISFRTNTTPSTITGSNRAAVSSRAGTTTGSSGPDDPTTTTTTEGSIEGSIYKSFTQLSIGSPYQPLKAPGSNDGTFGSTTNSTPINGSPTTSRNSTTTSSGLGTTNSSPITTSNSATNGSNSVRFGSSKVRRRKRRERQMRCDEGDSHEVQFIQVLLRNREGKVHSVQYVRRRNSKVGYKWKKVSLEDYYRRVIPTLFSTTTATTTTTTTTTTSGSGGCNSSFYGLLDLFSPTTTTTTTTSGSGSTTGGISTS